MTKLRGITWDHPRGYSSLVAASAEYERLTGVSVAWKKRSLQAFADENIDSLAENNDLIVLDHPHVGLIAESASLVPLSMPQGSADTSIGGSLESYKWLGKLWAYPIDAACQMAVKRPDLSAAEPSDWEDILKARTSDFRIVTPLLAVDAFDMMMTLVAGLGEDHLPFSGSDFVSQGNGVLALSVLKALFRLGPAEAVTWNPIKVLEAMSTTDEFAYSPCLFGYINYARPDFRQHALQYLDLPVFRRSARRRAILGGAGIGVSSQSQNVEPARQFARWVSSEPVQSGVFLENEGQPAHRETWVNKAGDPRFQGFFVGARKTMEDAWTRPRDVWFLGFVDEVCQIFPSFFLNDRAEGAFLRDINALYRMHKTRGVA